MPRSRQPLPNLLRQKTAGLYRRAIEWKVSDTTQALRHYQRTAGRLPGLESVEVTESGGLYRYSTSRETVFFPAPDLTNAVVTMSMGYQQWLRHKYQKPGFVTVERGDVVVDCGAFVGGFSLAVQSLASRVHAIEPAPVNFKALQRNLERFPHVECSNIGFFDRPGTMQMNISSTLVDNSLLSVDRGEVIDTVDVQLERIDSWATTNGIGSIDFLKLEAEGVEPEIAESIGELPIRKIAADCGPEREGEPTGPAVMALLSAKGYECRAEKNMVYAIARSEL